MTSINIQFIDSQRQFSGIKNLIECMKCKIFFLPIFRNQNLCDNCKVNCLTCKSPMIKNDNGYYICVECGEIFSKNDICHKLSE